MKNTIISIPTKEDWRKVVRKLLDEGCKWANEDKEINGEYFVGTRMKIFIENKKMTYTDIMSWPREQTDYKDYKLLTAQEFLGEYKFKVGDRVKILSKSHAMEYFSEVKIQISDLIGFITHIEDNGVIYVNRSMDDDKNWTFLKQDLQLLENPKFKVRDRIRIEKEPQSWSSLLGKCPLDLNYPREFVIQDIKEDIAYTAMGTKDGYGFNLSELENEENIKLLKDSKYEEITLNPFYGINMTIDYESNFSHESKFKKMRTFLLRKLSPNQRFLYQHGYKDETLDLTEKGKRLLMDVLVDKFEKEMVEIAKEEEKENKEEE